MKFHRFPTWLRDKVDTIILGEAGDGRGHHNHLVDQVYLLFLENCGSIKQFFGLVAGYYVTSRKQTLHSKALLDIGANGIAKLPEDMDDNDKHAVIKRRNKALVGDLVGAIRQSHFYVQFKSRDLYVKSLRTLDATAAASIEEELGILVTSSA